MCRIVRIAVNVVFISAAVLSAGPLVWVIYASLIPAENITQASLGPELVSEWKFLHLSLGQYRSVLLESSDYLIRFWNSVLLVFPVIIGQPAAAVLTSYGLSRGRGRLFSVILFMYLIIMLLPYQVTVIPNYYSMRYLHLLDTNYSIWLPGIFAPFSVYLLTRYMKRIPSEIIEAAEIDGAGDRMILLRVILPSCKGVLAALSVLVLIDYWNQVEIPIVMFRNAFRYPLSVFLSSIHNEYIDIAFAATAIYVAPLIFVFLFGTEYIDQMEP